MKYEINDAKATIVGEIVEPFEKSHEVFGEQFYTSKIRVKRRSDHVDILPIMLSEFLYDVTRDHSGELVQIQGDIRSYNVHSGTKNHLMLHVFVQQITPVEKVTTQNDIMLEGYICKDPILRKTPAGKEICDILLAVNKRYGKSHYIPCICWGRTAAYTHTFPVGTHVKVIGRFQSRSYNKKLEDGSAEEKIAYEVSVSKLTLVRGGESTECDVPTVEEKEVVTQDCVEVETSESVELIAGV